MQEKLWIDEAFQWIQNHVRMTLRWVLRFIHSYATKQVQSLYGGCTVVGNPITVQMKYLMVGIT